MNRPKRGNGVRSGLYAESKFSNWSGFNPYRSEFERISPSMRPVARFESPGLRDKISIFVRKPHPEFLRPCDVDDVLRVLAAIPVKFLEGLRRICLLGGRTSSSGRHAAPPSTSAATATATSTSPRFRGSF